MLNLRLFVVASAITLSAGAMAQTPTLKLPLDNLGVEHLDIVVPDTAAELVDPPGRQLLEELRRAPRAIEPPRADRRPDDPAGS